MENFIHESSIIHPSVKIGKGNFIGPYVNIQSDVEIGDNNVFESHVSIGSPAEHKAVEFNRLNKKQDGKVIIGNGNYFREFLTINKPTINLTQIGNDCYLMRGCHISHDTIIEDKVIMSCDVILGGHSYVMEGTYCGIGSATHPFTVLGPYSILGMGAVVTKHIPPVSKIIGTNILTGLNKVGMKRSGIEYDYFIKLLKKWIALVYTSNRKEMIDFDFKQLEEINDILTSGIPQA